MGANDGDFSRTEMHAQYFVMICLCCLIRSVVLYYLYHVMQNYGKGLKPYFKANGDLDFWGLGNKALLGTDEDLELGDGSTTNGMNEKLYRENGRNDTEMSEMDDTPRSQSR